MRRRFRQIIGRCLAPESQQTGAPYVYTPLDEEASEIRIMTLLPGQPSSEIRVVLESAILTEEITPQYEALSYAWGSAENLVKISIGNSNETLGVTQNLATALPYLRYEHTPRRLWIDAICVDQQNLTERSSQVLRMGDVFRLAERVVVWLGPESETSNLAMETMRSLSSKIHVSWNTYTIKPSSPEYADRADPTQYLPYEMATWDAIYDLLNRTWFERLWVQQEIRLANPSAVVMCGFDLILWPEFCDAIYSIRVKAKPHLEPEFDQRLELAYQMKRVLYNIVSLIQRTRSSKCSDPRDRVYAFLSLTTGSVHQMEITPDYTRATSEVYQDFALKFLETDQRLSILGRCDRQDNLADMPSWVPDWSVPSEIQWPLGVNLACGRSAGKSQYMGEGILKTTGVIYAVINRVQDMTCSYKISELVATFLRLTPPEALNISNSYIGGSSLFEAYCRTFCCDEFAERYIPPRGDFPTLKESKTAFYYFLANQKSFHLDNSASESRCWDFFFDFSQGRSLITTKEGYIGLAPKMTKAGDVVCVLLGCDTPLVFRPTESGQYQVLGECYICGLMDTQALLGPLPAQFQLVVLIDDEHGYHPAFLNRETGKTVVDDPRLGPLPAGWRKRRHMAEGVFSIFIKDSEPTEAGTESDAYGKYPDPRLTAEALAERNVELTVFELI